MTEPCDRCGSSGKDRRTLEMACFSRMDEVRHDIKVPPYKTRIIFSAPLEALSPAREPVMLPCQPQGEKVLVSGTVTAAEGTELTPQILYTLRVCKDCRADWLDAIQQWYESGVSAR